MKQIAIGLAALLACGLAVAKGGSHMTGGYVKKDGTYVAPHMQTDPNATKLDNYSTKGNYNPYTGKEGTVDPYKNGSAGANEVRPLGWPKKDAQN